MTEFWIGKKHGEIGLEDYRNLLALFPNYADRAIASALRSEGFRLKNVIRQAIQAGGPEGAKWPKLSPHTLFIRRMIQTYRKRQARIAKGVKVKGYRNKERHVEVDNEMKPLQKLAGASRYFYNPGEKMVTVGFLDQSRRELAQKHARGFEIVVTPRSRRFHFAVRMPLAAGTTKLKVPARPVVSVIFEREGKQIRQNVYSKVFSNVARYLTDKAAQAGEVKVI